MIRNLYMIEATKDDVDLSSFELNNKLNDKLWKDGRLNIKARKKMLMIARDFIKSLVISDFSIDDVIMTGSLANYNWKEEYSDIDLHIVTDFSEINDDTTLVKAFFNAVKSNWNQEHTNLKICGYPVEIYVQDTNETHASSGVYSVLNDEWIITPSYDTFQKKMISVDSDEVKDKVASFMTEIDDVENDLGNIDNNSSPDEISDLINTANDIYQKILSVRRSELSSGKSEASLGNLIFKTLRRNGYIKKLIGIRRSLYDLIHSLE